MFESAGGLLTIDLKAIQSNYHRLCKELNGQDCSVVVKADAYGLGVEPVSKALWDAGARTFFVALPDEGVTLRHILPDADIHILGGLFKGAADVYTTHNLIPVLNSLEQVKNWQNRGRADIQVDTGMTRLGIAMKDIGHIPSGLQTDVLMTHFACADEQGHPLTSHQIEAFTLAVDKIGHKRASLCNSAGIFLGKKAHFDLGRPGCSLYGINPTPHTTNPMQNPVHLQGKVIQLHEIDTQHSVGYGATYQLHSGQKLATIAVGYADGYLRCLGSAATVYVDGQAAPVVGRVSMDAISVDVSGLECSEGQYVDIIGPDNTPDDLAKWAHTIGYEILTSLGNRYKRVYKG
jgi:alanine racemase